MSDRSDDDPASLRREPDVIQPEANSGKTWRITLNTNMSIRKVDGGIVERMFTSNGDTEVVVVHHTDDDSTTSFPDPDDPSDRES